MYKIKLLKMYGRWEEKRNNDFLKMLERNQGAKVIDLGCGKGEFTLKVKEKIECPEICGVDIWTEGLKATKEKGINIKKMGLDQKLKLPSDYYDVVISNQVIEHLSYPSLFVKEMYRITKKGGYAVISTENLCSWDNIFALIFGHTPFSMQFDGGLKIGNPFSPHNEKKFEDYQPHMRIFSFKGLIELLTVSGFKVENIAGSGYFPFNFLSNLDPQHARFITVKVKKVI